MLDLLRGSARVPVSPLRKLREASGLSQGECAKIAGISTSRLSLAEHGFVNLTARQETAVRSHIIKVSKERFGQVLTEADPAFEKAVELIGRNPRTQQLYETLQKQGCTPCESAHFVLGRRYPDGSGSRSRF